MENSKKFELIYPNTRRVLITGFANQTKKSSAVLYFLNHWKNKNKTGYIITHSDNNYLYTKLTTGFFNKLSNWLFRKQIIHVPVSKDLPLPMSVFKNIRNCKSSFTYIDALSISCMGSDVFLDFIRASTSKLVCEIQSLKQLDNYGAHAFHNFNVVLEVYEEFDPSLPYESPSIFEKGEVTFLNRETSTFYSFSQSGQILRSVTPLTLTKK